MFSVNTQHSEPYTATGLITVWYSLALVFLVISFRTADALVIFPSLLKCLSLPSSHNYKVKFDTSLLIKEDTVLQINMFYEAQAYSTQTLTCAPLS